MERVWESVAHQQDGFAIADVYLAHEPQIGKVGGKHIKGCDVLPAPGYFDRRQRPRLKAPGQAMTKDKFSFGS